MLKVQYLGEDNPFGEEDDEEMSPEAYVSFIPVYKTMHVFKKLVSTHWPLTIYVVLGSVGCQTLVGFYCFTSL